MWLKDKILNDYERWEDIGIIFLSACTGAGKTFFIIYILIPFAIKSRRKIRIFAPRKILERDYLCKIRKMMKMHGISAEDVNQYVELQTYQKSENQRKSCLQGDAFYEVYDESHYWHEDALYNPECEESYLYAMHSRARVKIFISATGERIFDKIKAELKIEDIEEFYRKNAVRKEEGVNPVMRVTITGHAGYFKEYTMQADYLNYAFVYLQPDFQIVELTKLYQGKWLVMGGSIEQLTRMKEELDEAEVSCRMLCRRNVEEEEEVVTRINYCENYVQRVLLASKVIDTGINIVDRDVKNILLLCKTRESAVQMLGRKRLLEGEHVNVFVVCEKRKTFEDLYFQKANVWREYVKLTQEKRLLEAFGTGRLDGNLVKNFVYYDTNGEMNVSTLAIEQLLYEMEFFDDIRKELSLDEKAWGKRQAGWFEKNVDEVTELEENIREEAKEKIGMWIEGILSKEAVPKEEIKAWINEDTIACWIRVLLSKSCKEISVEALNKALKAERMEYQVKAVGRQENNNSQIQIYKFVKELMEQEN